MNTKALVSRIISVGMEFFDEIETEALIGRMTPNNLAHLRAYLFQNRVDLESPALFVAAKSFLETLEEIDTDWLVKNIISQGIEFGCDPEEVDAVHMKLTENNIAKLKKHIYENKISLEMPSLFVAAKCFLDQQPEMDLEALRKKLINQANELFTGDDDEMGQRIQSLPGKLSDNNLKLIANYIFENQLNLEDDYLYFQVCGYIDTLPYDPNRIKAAIEKQIAAGNADSEAQAEMIMAKLTPENLNGIANYLQQENIQIHDPYFLYAVQTYLETITA